MRKALAILTCIALMAVQIFVGMPFSILAADEEKTTVYSFDYTNSSDTNLWATGGVDDLNQEITLRSVQFSDENSMANITGSREGNALSYLTRDGSNGLRFKSVKKFDDSYYLAQCAIQLEEGATYELVTNARVTGSSNTFDIMITDQISHDSIRIPDDVSVYATNNYVTGSFSTKTVEFTATRSDVYLTLRLQAASGIMGRVKSIVINKIASAPVEEENDSTVNKLYERYYHTIDFGDTALYGEAITSGGTDYRSLDFANDAGKTNVTNNGTVFRYTDASNNNVIGLRIKNGSAAGAYTSSKEIKLKPNTEYVMYAIARVFTSGTLNISVKGTGKADIDGGSIAVSSASVGHYVTRFTTGSLEDATVELNYDATEAYKGGLLYDLAIYPLETSPVNGAFDGGNLIGWTQHSTTEAVLSLSNVRGGHSMKVNNGSNVFTYFLAKKGTNIAYMWLKGLDDTEVNQTVKIYKMDIGERNTLASEDLLGSMSAPALNSNGYTLFKFTFDVEEDTIAALNLNPTEKAYFIDQIYVLPEVYASCSTFDGGMDGYKDTISATSEVVDSEIISTEVQKKPAVLVDNAIYLDGSNISSEAETILNLKAGETYKLSYSVKVENGGEVGTDIAKPEVMLVDVAKGDSSNIYKTAHYKVEANDGWEYKTAKITPAEDTVYRLVLRCKAGAAAYFDNVLLYKLGDIDGDSLVNAIDISMVRNKLLNNKSVIEELYDVNEDGKVNAVDVVVVKKKLL